mmetsp:Transcript_20163/g.51288  ORF Transcript_20163/g.51288 Transcript_20163/m.51288 type:complete len:300 (-) Transcript_20163:138-1037(-)
MSFTCVRVEDEGGIRVLQLSRPGARNAWTETMRGELEAALDQASRDPSVRVVIITGDPQGGAFCAGMDLKDAGGPAASTTGGPAHLDEDLPPGRPNNQQWWRDGGGTAGLAIIRSTKPVIAAVNGSAVGVGMTLPLCCDMTVAAEEAKVGFVFGKRGLTMECLSSTMLSRCVGHKQALELVLTGRVFAAKDAPPGLFNYVVPASDVLVKAKALATEVCQTSPQSAMINRYMVLRNAFMSPEEAHLIESRSIFTASHSKDSQEGIMSFLEKREPKWATDPFRDAPDFVPWWMQIQTRSKL